MPSRPESATARRSPSPSASRKAMASVGTISSEALKVYSPLANGKEGEWLEGQRGQRGQTAQARAAGGCAHVGEERHGHDDDRGHDAVEDNAVRRHGYDVEHQNVQDVEGGRIEAAVVGAEVRG